jgi:hypothetical protein
MCRRAGEPDPDSSHLALASILHALAQQEFDGASPRSILVIADHGVQHFTIRRSAATRTGSAAVMSGRLYSPGNATPSQRVMEARCRAPGTWRSWVPFISLLYSPRTALRDQPPVEQV